MADHCTRCQKDIGIFSTILVDGKKHCPECASAEKADRSLYAPDEEAIKRALSALLTQDPDTKKLFEEGSRTYVKFFGGDINNFINLNSNLIQASILLKILEKLESIEKRIPGMPTTVAQSTQVPVEMTCPKCKGKFSSKHYVCPNCYP